MLAHGIRVAATERGISQRDLGKRFGYRQSVVLSHMASGRVPIPIDRAVAFAKELHLDEPEFLLAVLEQRHPDVEFESLLLHGVSQGRSARDGTILDDLEAIGGRRLSDLPSAQMDVVKEAVADANAHRRWLSIHELPAIELLRRLKPSLGSEGLTAGERQSITEALSKR
jgi:transcriptional regulator with XRE-family HTH domain